MNAANGSQRSWFQRNRITLAPWLFVAPALLFFSVYVIIPIFQSITISFYEWNGLYNAQGESTATWVGLQNYEKLLDDERFFVSLKNNVIWLVFYMLAVPAGLAIALFLNQTVTGIRTGG